MFLLTAHARLRITQRDLTAAEMAAAVGGKRFALRNGLVLCYDPVSKTGVIVNPENRQILSAYRLKKKQIKEWCSRRSEDAETSTF